MIRSKPHALRIVLTIVFSLFLVSGAHADSYVSQVSMQNPSFADMTGDGMPDGWSAYPGGDGLSLAKEGGVWIDDANKSAGLGLAQWVPVTEGKRYTLSLDLAGEGGLFAYMIFLEKKPRQAKQIPSMTLKEKRQWAKGGGAESLTTTVSEIAPAGAKFLRVWIYSPSSGTTNVRATGISLQAESLAPLGAISVGEPGVIPEGCLIQNPDFQKVEIDRTPSDWEVYPPANGSGTQVVSTNAGLRLTDSDQRNGVGLSQWIPVEAGNRYVVKAEVQGSQGLFLYSIFASEKPAQKSRYSEVEISQKREWAKSGKIAQVASVAPEGAKWMRVWLYSASSGTSDVIVKQITATIENASGDAAAVAAGLFNWMDFETGDMSQAASREGADREIVKKGEGPVREGNYAYRAMLSRSKERTELVGPRSPAYGVVRYGWSIFVPEDFDGDTFFSIITQWHDWGSGKEYIEDGGAPTHLYISKGDWRFKLRYQGEDDHVASTQFPLGSIDADRGQWTDWVMEVNWQAPGDGGWMKLYKNDELVVDYTGPTWYAGKDKGPYYKFGIYRGSKKWPGSVERSKLVFDAFRMALGDRSTYEQVAPSAYEPRKK
ncbi:polysaccharide lyase [Coraliomargarita sp. SDUM461003]|uniref:Polysaccharide lyase n=1 Tax=Thalassobacterium maritimum TaxID=3041265 RepID=A0ABU1AT57_9BACT|nr:polysaccharide lyase [Coraliomargarita sp. SDUM461003]MDQ8206330.1 polysaccharide lyase [Coraliomargarita sp. SDUM461003]